MDKNFVLQLLDKNGNPSRLKKKTILSDSDIRYLATIHPVINASLYCVLHNVTPPICHCGNLVAFRNFKYGFGNTCSPACSSKLGATCVQKLWETATTEKRNEIQEKRKATMTKTYGYDHPLKCPDIVDNLKTNRKAKDYQTSKDTMLRYFSGDIESHDYWKELCSKYTSIRKLSDAHGVFFAYVYRWWEKIQFDSPYPRSSSGGEREIGEFLSSIGVDHICNDRHILQGKELDIYIPSHNVAIEFDGIYWHKNCSSRGKQILAAHQGVSLLCIFEDEWEHKRDIVKSMILDKLGMTRDRIYARQTKKLIVSKVDAEKFLNDNHIAGFAVSKVYIGLYHNCELVCLAAIGKSRFGDREQELIRFCTKKNTKVIGGLSKLIKGMNLVSYADRRYSPISSAYEKLGTLIGETQNGYFWVYKNRRLSRFQTQKHKLASFLKTFDATKTEKENMELNGAYMIYDCGHWKYRLF